MTTKRIDIHDLTEIQLMQSDTAPDMPINTWLDEMNDLLVKIHMKLTDHEFAWLCGLTVVAAKPWYDKIKREAEEEVAAEEAAEAAIKAAKGQTRH